MLNRRNLLVGAAAYVGGSSLLAGCSGGAVTPLSSGSPALPKSSLSLADAMKKVGVQWVVDSGKLYRDDGSVIAAPANLAFAKLRGTQYVPCTQDCGISPDGTAIIGVVSTTYGYDPTGTSWAIQGSITDYGYYDMGPQTGPLLGLTPVQTVKVCAADIAGAVGMAWSFVGYIRSNPTLFTGNLVSTAESVFNAWNGTTMGLSAAAEFIGAVITSVAWAEVVYMLVGAGATAVLISVAWQCYNNGFR